MVCPSDAANIYRKNDVLECFSRWNITWEHVCYCFTHNTWDNRKRWKPRTAVLIEWVHYENPNDPARNTERAEAVGICVLQGTSSQHVKVGLTHTPILPDDETVVAVVHTTDYKNAAGIMDRGLLASADR